MADIINDTDLEGLPGLHGTAAQLQYAARRASNKVTDAWCSPVSPVPQCVKDIAIDVAARYLANPSGVSSTTRTLDDASRTDRFYEGAENAPRGAFYLEAEELARLCPKIRRPVGSIRLGVPGFRQP